jgi:hypothetical protein
MGEKRERSGLLAGLIGPDGDLGYIPAMALGLERIQISKTPKSSRESER